MQKRFDWPVFIVYYANNHRKGSNALYTMQTNQNAPIETLLQAIGENLEKRTRQARLDKKELARLADLNRNTVGAALSGNDIRLSTLIRLTRVLGFSDWLLPLLETPLLSPLEQLTPERKPRMGGTPPGQRRPSTRPLGRRKEDGT